MKKLFALVLTLALCLSMAACGSTATSTAASTAASADSAAASAETAPAEEAPAEETTPAEETSVAEPAAEASTTEPVEEEPAVVINYPLFDDPTSYTLWTSNSPDLTDLISDLNQYTVFEELEKVTNVKWDATLVSFMSSDEQFQLMVASGDYTDVVCRALDSYSGTIDQAIEEDFLIDLKPYFADNMPNLTKWFEKYPDLEKELASTEGAIAAFPKIYKETSDVTSGGCLRADWLDDLGLELPQTYDDLYNVLTAFRDEKGATAPLVISVDTGVQSDLLNGYNVGAGFYQVDNEIRFGPCQAEFKDYLTMMNKWYAEGLVDDLFLTQDSDNLRDMDPIVSGTCGVWYGTGIQSITQILSMESDPNMAITGITSVTTDGSKAHLGEVGSNYDSNMWSITTACEDPEVICQYIDYIYGDDGILLANYGVEGETFEYDANGKPYLTELVTNNETFTYNLALNVFTCDRQTPIPFVIDEDKSRNDYSEDQLNTIEVWNDNTDGLYNLPKTGIQMTDDEMDEYNTKYSDIDTYLDENLSKFIVGDRSLDEFDDFVDTLEEMGIEDCIALEQAAYDRYLAA